MDKLKEFLKILKTNKRSRLIFVIVVIVLGIVVKLIVFPKGPLQEGTPFTVEEYEEILDKKNLTKNGIPKDVEDYILKGEEMNTILKTVKDEKIKKTVRNILLLSGKRAQLKLENYKNPVTMDRLEKETGEDIHCLSRYLPPEAVVAYKFHRRLSKRNSERSAAVLNADRYYGFKIIKSSRPSKSECDKILNRELNENI